MPTVAEVVANRHASRNTSRGLGSGYRVGLATVFPYCGDLPGVYCSRRSVPQLAVVRLRKQDAGVRADVGCTIEVATVYSDRKSRFCVFWKNCRNRK